MTEDTNADRELEQYVQERVDRIIDTLEMKLEEDASHLTDPEYVTTSNLTQDRARELFEERTTVEYDKHEMTCAILEFYYNYRPETGASRDVILAAATYNIINKFMRRGLLTRTDVGTAFGVSESSISDHTLDMIENRFIRPEAKESREQAVHLMRIWKPERLEKYEEFSDDESTRSGGLSSFE